MINWPRFVETVRAADRILLTSHVRPDCDALGSELGLAGVLRTLGKNVKIVNGDPTPPNLAFIDPQNDIKVIGRDVQLADLADRQLIIILDTSAWAQLGPMGEVIKASLAKKIILDHHVSEDELGAEPFKNTTAEATGRLVVEAAEQLAVKLTPEIAMPLFAAVATDTGWFRFSSTSATTYRVGAQLAEAGAKPDWIYRSLYEQDTLARMRLRGMILTRLAVELDGRLIYTHVSVDDFKATGALPSDTEDAINLALGVRGTEVAVIFVEQAKGGFKISFRSRSKVDCSTLAQQFGGGGHKAAAGAYVAGAYPEVSQQVLDAVRATMR